MKKEMLVKVGACGDLKSFKRGGAKVAAKVVQVRIRIPTNTDHSHSKLSTAAFL